VNVPAAWLAELVALAAIWGGSFLFMRVCGADFGPAPLAALRATGAALLLMPLVAWRGQLGDLRRHWRAIGLIGITNSALPFLCFAWAALAITAGLSSIFNATTPLWGALVAWAWLGDRPDRGRIAGLATGFLGVLWLAHDKASLKPGEHGVSSAFAILACLCATLLYGWSANYARRRLAGVPPLAVAAGMHIAAVPVQFADAVKDGLGLRSYLPPIDVPVPDVNLYWHSRYDNDLAHKWLRGQITDSVRALGFVLD